MKAFTVDVTSDLHKVLELALSNLVKKGSVKFQAAVHKEITDRLQGPLAQTRGSLAGLYKIGAALS